MGRKGSVIANLYPDDWQVLFEESGGVVRAKVSF